MLITISAKVDSKVAGREKEPLSAEAIFKIVKSRDNDLLFSRFGAVISAKVTKKRGQTQ